ncbi:hypothetical protein [Erysipelothrix rhusiopathiae]|uniref:hypothetical protein n=1 Tax=Erysipelothrix rhusiopathiae TaxID=1648 RepID=UPI003BF5ABBD
MKRHFKHNSGAYVVVDDQGKKTLHKHGRVFKSFAEIKSFEEKMKRNGIDLNTKADKDSLRIYREYRQK